MNKKQLKQTALAAALAAVSSSAFALSNVSIYGIVDTGYVYESGHDVRMGANIENRIGFRGTEDLGNGLKAFFTLEKRFELSDGTTISNPSRSTNNRYSQTDEFDGEASVGLKHKDWGSVTLGRVNELKTETIRTFDPFDQYSVGAMLNGYQKSEGISRTIRYDSPVFAGFRFGATYSGAANRNPVSAPAGSIGDFPFYPAPYEDGKAMTNDGYGVMLGYDNGPLSLVANLSRLADSGNSIVWNLGASYRYENMKFSFVHQQTKDYGYKDMIAAPWRAADGRGGRALQIGNQSPHTYVGDYLQEKQFLLGLEWKLGPGRLNASAQYMRSEFHGDENARLGMTGKAKAEPSDIYKYAIGYTYDLSKRTSLYGIAAYTDYDDSATAAVYGAAEDSVVGVQFGITHRF